jgi:hypothetical protein
MPYRGGSEAAVRPVCVYGLEHLQDSLKRGSGAILWESGYFGRSNLAKHILYQKGFSIDQCMPLAIRGDSGQVATLKAGPVNVSSCLFLTAARDHSSATLSI